MKILSSILVLLMISLSSAIAYEEKVYDAVCINKEQLKKVKVIEEKDGYQLVEYQNQILVLIQECYLKIPKNKCKVNEIPLFIQP